MTYSLDFLSRDCRNNDHNECSGLWHGLGLEINCNCMCHDKKQKALAEIGSSSPNARNTDTIGEQR